MARVYTPNASPNPNSYAEREGLLDDEKTEWHDQEDSSSVAVIRAPSHSQVGRAWRRRIFLGACLTAVIIAVGSAGSTIRPEARRVLEDWRVIRSDAVEAVPTAFSADSPLIYEEVPGAQHTHQDAASQIPEVWIPASDQREEYLEVPDTNQEIHDEDLDDVYIEVPAAIAPTESASVPQSQPTQIQPDHNLATRPQAPSAKRPPLEEERFISFLPHSGYHNQRIALTNALLLGQILNRTVLLPYVRVGNPISWREKSRLQFYWDQEQKTQEHVDECAPHLPDLEAGTAAPEVVTQCSEYNSFAQFSWSLLINLQKTGVSVPVVDRPDLSLKWLISKEGLGLKRDEIYRFSDPSQYENQFYMSPTFPKIPTESKGGNYNQIFRIDDLLTEKMDQYRLIEFGSLYGSYRIVLDGDDVDPAWQQRLDRIQKAMVFDFPLLDKVASSIRRSMGGPDHFFGLHLRVGDGAFERTAIDHMKSALMKTLTSVFGFKESQAAALLTGAEQSIATSRHVKRGLPEQDHKQQHLSWEWTEGHRHDDAPLNLSQHESGIPLEDLDDHDHSHTKRQTSFGRQMEPITCRGKMHTAKEHLVLNAHVYIATDSRHPREDPALSPFFELFPCAHILSDFEEVVPALKALEDLRSAEEHVKVNRFLAPFLEAIIASSAVRMVGTSGSTFSWFVGTTLHKSFWPKQAIQLEKQNDLLASLQDGIRADSQ